MSKITELVEKLSPDLQKEVVNFIEFLIKEKPDPEDKKLNKTTNIKKLKGIFNSYADTSKIESEKEAWQSYVLEKWRKTQ